MIRKAGNRSYVYKSVRLGKSVITKYIGDDEIAKLQDVAAKLKRNRTLEAKQADEKQAEQEAGIHAEVIKHYRAGMDVLEAAMLAAGFAKDKRGPWRKRMKDS